MRILICFFAAALCMPTAFAGKIDPKSASAAEQKEADACEKKLFAAGTLPALIRSLAASDPEEIETALKELERKLFLESTSNELWVDVPSVVFLKLRQSLESLTAVRSSEFSSWASPMRQSIHAARLLLHAREVLPLYQHDLQDIYDRYVVTLLRRNTDFQGYADVLNTVFWRLLGQNAGSKYDDRTQPRAKKLHVLDPKAIGHLFPGFEAKNLVPQDWAAIQALSLAQALARDHEDDGKKDDKNNFDLEEFAEVLQGATYKTWLNNHLLGSTVEHYKKILASSKEVTAAQLSDIFAKLAESIATYPAAKDVFFTALSYLAANSAKNAKMTDLFLQYNEAVITAGNLTDQDLAKLVEIKDVMRSNLGPANEEAFGALIGQVASLQRAAAKNQTRKTARPADETENPALSNEQRKAFVKDIMNKAFRILIHLDANQNDEKLWKTWIPLLATLPFTEISDFVRTAANGKGKFARIASRAVDENPFKLSELMPMVVASDPISEADARRLDIFHSVDNWALAAIKDKPSSFIDLTPYLDVPFHEVRAFVLQALTNVLTAHPDLIAGVLHTYWAYFSPISFHSHFNQLLEFAEANAAKNNSSASPEMIRARIASARLREQGSPSLPPLPWSISLRRRIASHASTTTMNLTELLAIQSGGLIKNLAVQAGQTPPKDAEFWQNAANRLSRFVEIMTSDERGIRYNIWIDHREVQNLLDLAGLEEGRHLIRLAIEREFRMDWNTILTAWNTNARDFTPLGNKGWVKHLFSLRNSYSRTNTYEIGPMLMDTTPGSGSAISNVAIFLASLLPYLEQKDIPMIMRFKTSVDSKEFQAWGDSSAQIKNKKDLEQWRQLAEKALILASARSSVVLPSLKDLQPKTVELSRKLASFKFSGKFPNSLIITFEGSDRDNSYPSDGTFTKDMTKTMETVLEATLPSLETFPTFGGVAELSIEGSLKNRTSWTWPLVYRGSYAQVSENWTSRSSYDGRANETATANAKDQAGSPVALYPPVAGQIKPLISQKFSSIRVTVRVPSSWGGTHDEQRPLTGLAPRASADQLNAYILGLSQ